MEESLGRVFMSTAIWTPLTSDEDQLVKCVIWDLDNTLWTGTLAEGDEVQLKSGIKEILSQLDKRGILLSISSKNNFEDAFKKLQEFQIEHYFLWPQISWSAKSVGILTIQKSLNIGMNSLLFIDDQPFELEEVKAAHPDVQVTTAENYSLLLDDPRLNPKEISDDAALRRQKYQTDIIRKQDEDNYVGTPEDFLRSLNMRLIIAPAEEKDLLRAQELTVRTNQLNSTGITYDIDELRMFIESDKYDLLVCELTDKYGTYGKIGLALVERTEAVHHIRLLLMSCRTASRGIGSVLMAYLSNSAIRQNAKLYADFLRTDRNRQMYVTYKMMNFIERDKFSDGRIVFESQVSTIQYYPSYISVLETKVYNKIPAFESIDLSVEVTA